jgi:lipopolysaccharide biosynthesis glycosyltransferase
VSRLHIACASNAGYLPHVAAMLQSLAASNPLRDLTVHYLHDESLDAGMQEQLRGMAAQLGLRLELLHPASTLMGELPRFQRWSPLIWYRVFLPQLLPQLEQVLYLDADTLVLQDLRPLWHTPLEGSLLAAVAQHQAMDGGSDLQHLGVTKHSYFNSGVLLMDLQKMRAEHVSERVIEIGAAHAGRIAFPDQDAYNLACAGRWLPLHPKWNCFASVLLAGERWRQDTEDLRFEEASASPAILHFEGSVFAKPWHARCLHPHRQLYRAYRGRTPWPLLKLEGAGLAADILRRLPVEQQLLVSRLKRRVCGE